MALGKNKLAELAKRPKAVASSNTVDDITRRAEAAIAGVSERRGTELGAGGKESSAPQTAAAQTAYPTQAGAIVELPLDLIDDNPYNVRVIYPAQDLSDLATSIQAIGQEQPIKVFRRPDGSGRYTSVFGHRRRRACRIAGLQTVRAELCAPMNDRQLYAASAAENKQRTEQTVIDDAFVWQKLLADKVFKTQSEIAGASQKSEATVAKTLALLDMPELLLEFMKENPKSFGLRIAYALQQLAKKGFASDAIGLAKRVVLEEMTANEVEQAARDVIDPPTRKPKESSRQYKVPAGAAFSGGVLKDWDSGRVSLDVAVNSPEERASLVQKLKEVLGVSN